MQSSQTDKIKDKYKILKSTGKMTTYKWTPIRLLPGFSTEILQARREWHNIFKVMKGTDLQPRILYPARLIQIWWRNQKLSKQAKEKIIQHPISFTNDKGTFLCKEHKRRKRPTEKSSVHSLRGVSLQLHGLQHARLPCPSQTPGACSDSYP